MNTTQEPQTATLPVTGREVPAGLTGYTVRGYKSMRTVNGLADTANLYRGSRKVAVVHQDGNGGATFARFDDPAERTSFKGAVGDVEAALDALMLETLAARELRKNDRKYLCVLAAGDDIGDYKCFTKMPMSDALKAALVEKFGKGTRYWDGTTWVEVTA